MARFANLKNRTPAPRIKVEVGGEYNMTKEEWDDIIKEGKKAIAEGSAPLEWMKDRARELNIELSRKDKKELLLFAWGIA